MPGSLLHRSWEISPTPEEVKAGGTGKAERHTPVVNVGEKSDSCVVPKRTPNKAQAAEAEEGRREAKGNDGKPPASRTRSRSHASKGLDGVRQAARRNRRARFTALLHHVTPTLLEESFYALRRDAAVGVDGVTWREYEETLGTRVHELHREIHIGAYRAQASRRVYIQKADGNKRPLGIAALEDKIVQQAVATVLNAVYEQDFLGFSYGFRTGKSQHDALDALHVGIERRGTNWILDADISAFFDTIDHAWMMRFLEHRIGDKRLLRLITKWLKAGAIEDGKRIAAERGTPQGAVISPLLANIYLHYVLDTWAQQWRRRQAKGDVIIVRYADDSVMGFQHEGDAKRFLADMAERLAHFGLSLHPDKTRLIRFGALAAAQSRRLGLGKPASFDFLGFTHCCGKTQRGRFKIVRLTVKKRMRATLKSIREALLRRRHEPVAVTGRWLRRVVQGYFNYYAVPGNLRRLSGFKEEVRRAWRFALSRRSQRSRMDWARFERISRRAMPKVHTIHPYPDKRFDVTTRGRSRMR